MCQINLTALGGAALGLVVLAFCNRRGVVSLWPYLLIGAVVWFCVLQSGIHATLAGVAVAMTVPLACSPGRPDNAHAPLSRLEHGLHPWIAYAVVPLFGFANAGVALGLFLGKQLAILSAVFVLSRLKLADRPLGANWVQVYGVAVLCGIGFTMSLFIGGLAFGDGSHQNDAAKLGVLLGSILSAIAGYIVLRLVPRGHKAKSSNAF